MKLKKSKNPKGFTLLSAPVMRSVGRWSKMVVDAQIIRGGITWYRVKDGMGGRGDREDSTKEIWIKKN